MRKRAQTIVSGYIVGTVAVSINGFACSGPQTIRNVTVLNGDRLTRVNWFMKSPVRDVQILSLGGIIVAGLFVIGLRLWFVQVQMGAYYRCKGRDRSEISVRIPPLRGEILDRNGIVLATDRPSYDADFYLPDVVSGYVKEYGPPPMIEYLAKDENGNLAAPIASEIIQKIFALDHGYDPGLKPLAPAIGNYDLVGSVDFKAGNATTKLVSRGKMSSGNRSSDAEPDSSKVSRAQQVANDPRGAAYGHVIGQAERVQLEPRSFSDFTSRDSEYRRSTQQSQQLAEKKKKHHFLFF